jgi:hypothetical protein
MYEVQAGRVCESESVRERVGKEQGMHHAADGDDQPTFHAFLPL